MTRELKLALIVGFSLVLIVTVLVSDHLSKARRQVLAAPSESLPVAMQPEVAPPAYLPESPGARRDITEPELIATHARQPISAAPDEIGPDTRGGAHDIPEGFVSVETARPSQLVQGSAPAPDSAVGRPNVETAAPSDPVYVVAEGDTLYQIARQQYGPGADWQKIAQANGIRPESLKVGMKLRIPGVRTAVAPATTPASTKGIKSDSPGSKSIFRMYVVKRGDTLEGISRKMLGSPTRLSELIRANGLEDGDAIATGQTLRIPNS